MTYVLIWNTVVFLLYGWDKLMALRKGWRIPEIWLLLAAVLSGGVGALCGMVIFRHKTKKWIFRIVIPASLIITQIVILICEKNMI